MFVFLFFFTWYFCQNLLRKNFFLSIFSFFFKIQKSTCVEKFWCFFDLCFYQFQKSTFCRQKQFTCKRLSHTILLSFISLNLAITYRENIHTLLVFDARNMRRSDICSSFFFLIHHPYHFKFVVPLLFNLVSGVELYWFS